MRDSRSGIVAAVLPSFILLALFYSLAIHMYWSLGSWPTSIGEQGFPASLILHANLALYFFTALLWLGMFVLPVAIVVCLLRARWRRYVHFLALYALSFGICWGVMQLAPAQFLDWWWD